MKSRKKNFTVCSAAAQSLQPVADVIILPNSSSMLPLANTNDYVPPYTFSLSERTSTNMHINKHARSANAHRQARAICKHGLQTHISKRVRSANAS